MPAVVDPKVRSRGQFYQWSDCPRMAAAMVELAKDSAFLKNFGLHKADAPTPPQCKRRP